MLGRAREKAYFSRAKQDLREMATALELYAEDHGGNYPADVSRNVPPGLEQYLNTQTYWPGASWPSSVFDWDNWAPASVAYEPKEQIYQISVRFCPIGGPIEECYFPNETWAENFGINSSVYYCVSGPCRAHGSEAYDYPGYCLNCDSQPSGP